MGNAYDTVGNRQTAANTTGNWTYNPNNELGGYDDVSFEYDANGNMIKKTVGGVVTSYVYNIEDRLTEVWNGEVGSGSLIASYYYDPFGRRLWKEVGGVRTVFHYADEGLIGEYDSAGDEIRTYGYKPGSTWTTDQLFMKEGGQYYFYHNDHLGTPQQMTAVNGAVVWRAKYSSFGEAAIEVDTVENNLRFPGQYYDSETGLHYNWHRYYDPEIGRYLRAEPIGLDGGINLFAYVSNNPVNSLDPWGLMGLPPCMFGPKPSGDCWPNSPPDPPFVKDTYCKYGSTVIGASLDTVSILSYASVVGAEVGVVATALSACNTLIKVKVCGSVGAGDIANGINTGISLVKKIDVKVKIASTLVEMAIAVTETALQ